VLTTDTVLWKSQLVGRIPDLKSLDDTKRLARNLGREFPEHQFRRYVASILHALGDESGAEEFITTINNPTKDEIVFFRLLRGWKAYQAGEYRQVLSIAGPISLEAKPDPANIALRAGALFNLGEHETAQDIIDMFYTFDDENGCLQALWSDVLRFSPAGTQGGTRKAVLTEALGHLRRAQERGQRGLELSNIAGGLLRELGRRDESIVEFKRALAQPGTKLWPLLNLGHVYADLGKYDEAVKYYEKSLSEGFVLSAFRGLLDVLAKKSAYSEIIEAYSRYSYVASDDPNARYYAGIAYLRLGFDERAREHLNFARRRGDAEVRSAAAQGLSLLSTRGR
jgi:tetratricopeptide (TPR) repeat protein